MSAPQSHKGIILVADDNEANRELLSALLSAEGYQVVCAADGQQALARVNSGSVDLALLDVVMPRRTGFEICQEMKSKPETRLIPVILLTSLNGDADRIHGIMCGADDFLNKPVNKHELLARAHSLLRLKQFTDRKSTRLNSSHSQISYAVFCLKKKNSRNCIRVAMRFT